MKIFNLPDLGEGLPDAEINEWHVKVGDSIKVDEPLVSMETAKAVVEVPSPQEGVIAKLYGNVGDIIDTHNPLVAFEGNDEKTAETATIREDEGTVVGKLEMEDRVLEESATGFVQSTTDTILASTTVRAYANQFNIDITSVKGTGQQGTITMDDIKRLSGSSAQQLVTPKRTEPPGGYEGLRGVRRTMAISMAKSQQEVVPVTIFDEADIQAWPPKTDITFRIIQAIIEGCKAEPALNAWYDTPSMSRKCWDHINIGLAMDSKDGLFVPVLKDVEGKDQKSIRNTINKFKEEVKNRTISQDDLQGMTIMFSNFGVFAGKFASPIIVPPCVAILGTGRLFEKLSVVGSVDNDNVTTGMIHRAIPISLTFDHRAITGGEATRFLGTVIAALEKS